MSWTAPTTSAGMKAYLDVWRRFIASFPGGWHRDEPGLIVFRSGARHATSNGVVVTDDDADAERVLACLDEVAAAGSPYSMQGRASAVQRAVAQVADGRLRRQPARPIMTLERSTATLDRFDGIGIRQVDASEAEAFVATGAASFGTRPDVFREVFAPRAAAPAGIRSYLGEVEGRPVATACGITVGDAVGLFAIGTVAEERGKGYGAALTARAVEDGFRQGARIAVLQASRSGRPVYARMGFEAVDVWPVWVSV